MRERERGREGGRGRERKQNKLSFLKIIKNRNNGRRKGESKRNETNVTVIKDKPLNTTSLELVNSMKETGIIPGITLMSKCLPAGEESTFSKP